MTEALGQSQVINYLIGLTGLGYTFDILSFEKPDKFEAQKEYIKGLLNLHKINWYPQVFHTYPPVLSKIRDKNQLFKTAGNLYKQHKYDFIHCRSYVAAEAGLMLKKKFGVEFLFDMRGFWPDEKADGGSWNLKKLFWRKVYQFYKRKEREFIKDAAHIVSLTNAAKIEIESWPYYTPKQNISVIPCCADSETFSLTSPVKKRQARAELNISPDCMVLSYLGSLGTWYMIDEMMLFFAELKKKYAGSIFLLVTNSAHDIILDKLANYSLNESDIRIITVPFVKVPELMYASDISISFIKPVYSKMASSPIKIGETLSMGIPIIANNIGDSGLFVQQNNVGYMVQDVTEPQLRSALNNIEKILTLDPADIRNKAMEEYSLAKGVWLYKNVYESISLRHC